MGEIGDHRRDIRNHQKRRQRTQRRKNAQTNKQQANSNGNGNRNKTNPNNKNNNNNGPSQRCWDWILVGGTNHYAKNRASFSTYRRVLCQVGNMRVLGIGTVNLQVVRGPEDTRTNTLVLENVLHIPEAICNGISIDQYFTSHPDYDFSFRYGTVCHRDNGEPLWYGRKHPKSTLKRVVVAGDPQGEESKLKEGVMYSLSIHASVAELDELNRRVQNQCF